MYATSLRVASDVLDAMHAEARHHRGETGGVVLGPDEHTMTDLIVSGPGAHRTSSTYELDAGYLQPLLEQAEDRGLRFLAIWHVHPAGYDELSSTDRRTARKILADVDYNVTRLFLPLTVRTRSGLETRFFVAEGPSADVSPVWPVICAEKAGGKAERPQTGTRTGVVRPDSPSFYDARVSRDADLLKAAGWSVTLRAVADERAFSIEREHVRLWLVLPPEYPLSAPDVFVEGEDGLLEVARIELPETHHWSSVRSITAVADQALKSIQTEREAMRLFTRRSALSLLRSAVGHAGSTVGRVFHAR
jgi:proteasome lid subunit RPN8/RPN11